VRRPCRRLATPYRRRAKLWVGLCSQARIILDPKKLAQLNSDLANRRRSEEAEAKAAADGML
jgi:hypothetical protein